MPYTSHSSKTRETASSVPPFTSRSVEYGQYKSPTLKQPRQAGIVSLDMRVAYLLSALAHVSLPVILVVVSLLLMLLFGIDLGLFSRPEPKPKDLEFVLVPANRPEETPTDPNTTFRAERNMRAGGQHDPMKPVVLPDPAKPSPPAMAQAHPTPRVTPPKKLLPQKQVKKRPTELLPPIPPKAIAIPLVPQSSQLSSALEPPLNQSQPSPLRADSVPLEMQSQSVSQGVGSMGAFSNPGPGNKNDTLGVDAIREPDFGPYMKELQRRIKQSWRPPRGNESKQIVLMFRVDRYGKLLDIQVVKSSGEPTADQAAVLAIQQIFPFKPLPPEYAEEDIDIEFTFDYNVFNNKERLGNRLGNS